MGGSVACAKLRTEQDFKRSGAVCFPEVYPSPVLEGEKNLIGDTEIQPLSRIFCTES
jgi:hypothetical protein